MVPGPLVLGGVNQMGGHLGMGLIQHGSPFGLLGGLGIPRFRWQTQDLLGLGGPSLEVDGTSGLGAVNVGGAGLLRAPSQLQAVGQPAFQLGLAGHPSLSTSLGLGMPIGYPGLGGATNGLSSATANLMAHPLLGLAQQSSGNVVMLPRIPWRFVLELIYFILALVVLANYSCLNI